MNTDFLIPDIDPKRNGKIAHLPRALRDQLNQRLFAGETAVKLMRWLNQLPEVKTILARHFDGRPLNQQNLTEWKHGGFREWLQHQQILRLRGDLVADTKELSDVAKDLADHLFGVLTLDYAQALKSRATETPNEFEKKRKTLSVLAQDIVRLRRSHHSYRRVEIQQTRLDRDEEKTNEQLYAKFIEWVENPDIRKILILAPLERLRRLRKTFELPPRPEDPLVEKETQNDPFFDEDDKNQTEIKPSQTENLTSNPDNKEPAPSGKASTGTESYGGASVPASRSPAAETSSVSQPSTHPTLNQLNDDDEPDTSDIPQPQITPGKTTQQLIAECEEYAALCAARKKAHLAQKVGRGTPCPPPSPLPASTSASPLKSPLSPPQQPAPLCESTSTPPPPNYREYGPCPVPRLLGSWKTHTS